MKFRFAVLTCIMALAAAQAGAADYPARPIRLIVPYAPGGATDITSRTISPKLGEKLGQQIVVDNRPGGAAIIGMNLVAKSPPDGYTLLMATMAFGANPALYSKLPYDSVKDFHPVSMVAIVPTVLAINPSIPARSAKELIAFAKAKPGTLNFGSAGNGTVNHLAGELLRYMTGTNMVHVPYKGGGLVVAAVIGGEISMVFATTPTSLEFFRAGKLIPLAVSGAKRLALLPEIPTLGETVSGFDAVEWQGIVVPAGTSLEIITRLHKDIVGTLAEQSVKDRIATLGAEAVGGTPQAFEAHIKAELAKWAKVVKELKIQVD